MGQGDTKRVRSVKADFDADFQATSHGGVALLEKALRRLGIRRAIGQHLCDRVDSVVGVIAGLLLGGRGLHCAERFCEDVEARRILGLEDASCSDSSLYRLLGRLVGLAQRKEADVYEPAGPVQTRLDMFGQEKSSATRRRIVPAQPERAESSCLAALGAFLGAIAVICLRALPSKMIRLDRWHVVFGDATDLEVEGHCFDAARMGRDGKKTLRWQTVSLGPVLVAEQLHEGHRDEGKWMPSLLEAARVVIGRCLRAKAPVLALMDAAYFEWPVVSNLIEYGWQFIICANQWRNRLLKLALQLPEAIWSDSGADARRGWVESHVGCFIHQPEGWERSVTIVARRWRETNDLPGVWHYSFLGTLLEKADIPGRMLKKHGYAQAIWMMYGTKQGRENHYKTPLRDLGLHHPPSGRLGVNQAFYALGAAASNIAMVLRYGVLPREERGMELWRLRERYFLIAGYVRQSGRTLQVWLSGVAVSALRQTLWREAFAAAGRL